MISKLRYGNSVIKYNIVKSKRRKTSEIRVDDTGVEIRTPITKKDSEIQEMINNKKQWIFKKQLEFKDKKRQRKKQFRIIYSDSYLDKLVKKLASKIGVKPSKIVVKPLKGRWGSATEKGVITLNSNLLKAPKNVIEYIIIHELCHLKIQNHSSRYWNLVTNFMPNYKEKVAWLEANSKSILFA